jgi:hypothetical protein
VKEIMSFPSSSSHSNSVQFSSYISRLPSNIFLFLREYISFYDYLCLLNTSKKYFFSLKHETALFCLSKKNTEKFLKDFHYQHYILSHMKSSNQQLTLSLQQQHINKQKILQLLQRKVYQLFLSYHDEKKGYQIKTKFQSNRMSSHFYDRDRLVCEGMSYGSENHEETAVYTLLSQLISHDLFLFSPEHSSTIMTSLLTSNEETSSFLAGPASFFSSPFSVQSSSSTLPSSSLLSLQQNFSYHSQYYYQLIECEIYDCPILNDVRPFSYVKRLVLSNCIHVKDVNCLSSVRSLSLIRLPTIMNIEKLGNVYDLTLKECLQLNDISSLINNYRVSITGCPFIHDYTPLAKISNVYLGTSYIPTLDIFNKIKEMKLESCYGTSFDLIPFSLRSLTLDSCSTLMNSQSSSPLGSSLQKVSFSTKSTLPMDLSCLANIPILHLIRCSQLTSLEGLSGRNKKVIIEECHSIEDFTPLSIIGSSSSSFSIEDDNNSINDERETASGGGIIKIINCNGFNDSHHHSFSSSLHHLIIQQCIHLTSLAHFFLYSVYHLEVIRCPNLANIEGIPRVHTLEIIQCDRLTSLPASLIKVEATSKPAQGVSGGSSSTNKPSQQRKGNYLIHSEDGSYGGESGESSLEEYTGIEKIVLQSQRKLQNINLLVTRYTTEKVDSSRVVYLKKRSSTTTYTSTHPVLSSSSNSSNNSSAVTSGSSKKNKKKLFKGWKKTVKNWKFW